MTGQAALLLLAEVGENGSMRGGCSRSVPQTRRWQPDFSNLWLQTIMQILWNALSSACTGLSAIGGRLRSPERSRGRVWVHPAVVHLISFPYRTPA